MSVGISREEGGFSYFLGSNKEKKKTASRTKRGWNALLVPLPGNALNGRRSKHAETSAPDMIEGGLAGCP